MGQKQTKGDYSARSKNNDDDISKLCLPCNIILERILTIHPLFKGLLDRRSIKHEEESAIVTTQDIEHVISSLFANLEENNPIETSRKLEYHFNQGLILTATIALNKKQLDLDFSIGKQEEYPYELENVFTNINFAQIGHCPSYVNTLKLTSAKDFSCDFVSSFIFKIIPFVKCFIINNCNGLRSLVVEGLDELIDLRVEDCVALNLVCVDALKLKSLRHCGNLCWFSFRNITYLDDVKLASKGPGFKNLTPGLFIPLLRAIRDVKVLTLHGWMFKEFFGPLLLTKHNEQHFRFSKLKDLWWIDNCMEDKNIKSLFSFLKFCTSLKRLFVTIDPQSYSSPDRLVYDNRGSNKDVKWRLRKLKVVKLEGITNEEEIMFFKEQLMKVFNAEPHVIMDTRCLIRTTKRKTISHTRCLMRTTKRKTFGKPVESKKLKFSYKFVEETEENLGLCSKHPHMP